MLSTIMRPMLGAMDGRGFRSFMDAFLRYADSSWGRVYNLAWPLGMGIAPIIALVLLWDDAGSAAFVLTAIGAGIVFVGVYLVSNVWKESPPRLRTTRRAPTSRAPRRVRRSFLATIGGSFRS
jgi:hypothetical protein